MAWSEQLSVVTPVSRAGLLSIVAPSVPPEAEWILVTDGPQNVPLHLRPHVLIEGPETRRWGDAQRQIGLEAATRPFVYFLDDDNLMLPMLAELVIPYLEAGDHAGAAFGLLHRYAGGRFYIWPPPTRVERSQVDTAMFLGRTEAARSVRWPDLHTDGWPHLDGQHCADFVFMQAFDERVGLLRLPAICGFHDGVSMIREFEPDVYAALERDELAPEILLGILHRYMVQADAPPWWKGQQTARIDGTEITGSVAHELLELAGSSHEGSSVPAQRTHFQALLRTLAADRPGQPVNVLEVGFNAGLGAAAFLEASPQAHVVSFDLAVHPYVSACAQQLRLRFPDRSHLVMGDSRETVPRYAAEVGGRFDLVLIDGGHDKDTCRADVLNTRSLAGPHALVIVDDLMPHKGYGIGVCQAWEELLDEQVLAFPQIWCARPGAAAPEADVGEAPERYARRWGVARFNTR
jgi:predicted O-methyltransferase YrrM